MNLEITLAPKNSLVLVMDASIGEIPHSMGDGAIVSTDSCVAIGTLSEVDGETTIVLTDQEDCANNQNPSFDGTLRVPTREISVCSVDDEKLITLSVVSEASRIRIFTNDPSEPDRVVILVS